MGKYSDEMLKILRELENKEVVYPCVGEVLSPPPNIKVGILGGKVILEKEHLYINNRLMNDYTRDFQIEGETTVTVNSSDMTKAGSGPHKHDIKKVAGDYKASGIITNTDTLKKGDKVRVSPTEDIQVWFLDYKIRRL